MAVLALPGAFDSAVGTVLNVAHAANLLHNGSARRLLFSVRACTPSTRRLSLGSGLTLSGLEALPAADSVDIVVVPGANQLTELQLLSWLDSRPIKRAAEWLAQAHASGAIVAAGCTGTFVAARAGLLDKGRATTTWWLAPVFQRLFKNVTLDMTHSVVRSGRAWTAGAAFAHADLMLQLVSHLGSPRLAALCSRYLLLDPRDLQVRYPLLDHLAARDEFLVRAERFASEHLAQVRGVDDLARAMAVSLRTLARRTQAGLGLTPLAFLQRLRLDRAIHILETTRKPVEEIAELVGYGDAATLRRLMDRSLGRTPSAVRNRVRRADQALGAP
jgi:transcriptional regulator GlxA family with amidase domain